MKARTAVLAALLCLILGSSVPALRLLQDDTGKPKQEPAGKAEKQKPAAEAEKEPKKEEEEAKKDTSAIKVPVKVSAEGMSLLPSGARIKWQSVDKDCSSDEGQVPLNSEGAAVMNLPPCKVKLIILITGFDAKPVTLEITPAKNKYKKAIGITVKHKGAPEVAEGLSVD